MASGRALPGALIAAALAGCLAKPDYQRPEVELPAAWKQTAPPAVLDGRWWTIYGDAALDALVEEALKGNTDLAVAVGRVDEARALLRDAEAAFYPAVDAAGVRQRTRYSTSTGLLPPGIPRDLNDTRLALDVSYEVDLWGRLGTAAQAARADLLATQAAQETVRIALAADVTKAWFGLKSLDGQVEATRRALKLREEALVLQQKRFEHGLISEFDYRQLEAEAAAVRAQLPPLERDRDAQEAALSVLLGRSPKDIAEKSIDRRPEAPDRMLPAVVPSGLPSELLLRRPDLVEAEQRLIAANARVAIARTAYFPSISLTGYLGSEAAAMRNLFTGPAGIWNLAAAIVQPIFSGGRLEAQTEAARARERQLVAGYQGTIRNAFREVRNALAAQTRARESFEAEDQRAIALRSALKLARLRYENGLASQLDVIDAERNLLAAEVARHEALRAQRAAIADLYKALGG